MLKEDETGILQETLDELAEVKNKLKEYKDKEKGENIIEDHSIRNIQLLARSFFILQDKPLRITGIALAEGDWKGVFYSPEEIQKATTQLKNTPVKIEHGKSTDYGERTVGKVIKANYDDMIKAIKFEAIIEDKNARKDILKERFKAVSMATLMNYEPQEGHVIGKDFEFQEISLVESPACETCQIFHYEQLSLVKGKNISNDNIIKEMRGELIMDKKTKFYLASEEFTIELPVGHNLSDLFKEVGIELIEDVEVETQNKDEEPSKKKRYKIRYTTYPSEAMPKDESTKEEKKLSDEDINKIVEKVAERIKKPVEETSEEEGEKEETEETETKEETEEKVEEFDEEFIKSLPIPEEVLSAYTEYIKKCMGEGKSMKACAAEWKPAEKKAGEKEEETEKTKDESTEETTEEEKLVKCSECDFEGTNEEVKEHIAKEHPDKYKEKYPEAKSEEKEKETPPKEEGTSEESSEEELEDEDKQKESLSQLSGAEAIWALHKFVDGSKGKKRYVLEPEEEKEK